MSEAGEELAEPLLSVNAAADHGPAAKLPGPFPWRTVLSLCSVGFLVNCQPSEPYLAKFLEVNKGISGEQLDTYVWPTNTYATFAFLPVIGFVAEYAGYLPVIGFGLLFREATRVALVFGRGVPWAAFTQVTYAAATVVNTIYFAYVYMAVGGEHYQAATAYVHAAYHAGNLLGSVLSQLLVSLTPGGDHLLTLFYLSWGFTSLGLLCFLTIMPPAIARAPPSLFSMVRNEGWRRAYLELRALYAHPLVQTWSLWWLLGFGGANIVLNYYQTQFLDVDPALTSLGTVEAIIEAFSVAGSLVPALAFAGTLGARSAPIIVVSSTAIALLLLASTWLQSSIWFSYAFNSLAIGIFSFQYAAASSVIAHAACTPRYAMLFVVNAFLAYALSSAVQAVASSLMAPTSTYYYAAAAEEVLLTLATLTRALAGR